MLLLRRLLPLTTLLLVLVQPALSTAGPSLISATKQDWIEVSSANFRVVTEQPEKFARQMIADLENLRYVSNRLRGAASLDGPPLTIVALGRTNAQAMGIPDDLAGIFHMSNKGYAAIAKVGGSWFVSDKIAESRHVFLHEYHHFLLQYTPESTAYPLWYNEGMSEYWSSMQIDGGKVWFGDDSQNAARAWGLFDASGKLHFDTRFLFNATGLKTGNSATDRMDNARFYSQARYAIHYFNCTPELRQQLAHYLRLYNMGLSQDRAVRIAFKRTYAELDMALRDYVKNSMVKRGFDIGPGGLQLPQVAVKVVELTRPAVLAVLADVVPRFQPPDSPVTRELVAANLAANPGDPDAHALDLELAQPAVDEATARLTELERRFPNNPRLLALHADILSKAVMQSGAAGSMAWDATAAQARALYRQSIGASAFNPRAYVGLANLYTVLPQLGPVEEGIAALDSAVIYEARPRFFRALADLYLRTRQLRPALVNIRSAVAFATREERPFDILMLENLELLMDLTSPSPTDTGLRFASGATYTGPLRDGKPDGTGAWRRPDGSSYEGEFKGGLPAGHGTLTSERGFSYDGDFSNGYARGKGHILFPPQSKLVAYDGEVVNATPHGAGALVTKDARVAATFRNGVPIDADLKPLGLDGARGK